MAALFGLVFSASLCAPVKATTTSEESDHDHEEHDLWEQSVVYSLDTGNNAVEINPADGASSFEDASFAFMIVPTSSADSEGLEEAEEDAEAGEMNRVTPNRPACIVDCRTSSNDTLPEVVEIIYVSIPGTNLSTLGDTYPSMLQRSPRSVM